MRLFSIDRVDGQRIGHFGSDFVLCPLADTEGSARITCFHLTSGELVGEHRAVVDQLFCVVAGEGWVSGIDGVPRKIRTNQAVHWSAGEIHAAGTESGLTAIVVEGGGFNLLAEPLGAQP